MLFTETLVDLGLTDPALRAILAPQSEIGTVKVGVTAQFLDNAADYHESYRNIEYFRVLIDRALAKVAEPLEPKVILDIGSGSGNSVIPLLDRFPEAFVVATDISPQLLAILRDHLEAHAAYAGRYALVCMDATNDHYIPESFDLAVGAAILHHIIEPGRVIRACASALRPGGRALFFEPFEMGHVLLKLAYMDIIAESERRSEREPGIAMLERIVQDLTVRMQDKSDPLFLELDDKWLFTRSFFDAATQGGRWEKLEIHPINSEDSPLTDQTRINLRLGLGADETALPDWAWAKLKTYETAFSRHARRDIVFEGGVILRKGGGSIADATLARAPDFETELKLGMRAPNTLGGWWWNPAEGGSGYFLAEKDGALTVVCCLYRDDGEADWYCAGPKPATIGNAWTAPCWRRALPSSTAPDTRVDGPPLTLHLDSPTSIRMQWGERQISLQRQHHSPVNAKTGLWIEDGDEAGYAMAVECLPDSVFAALLAPDGWCIAVAAARDHLTYAGQWLRFRSGQTRDGPWKTPLSEVAGGAHIAWMETDCVVVRLPNGRRKALTRFTAQSPPESSAPV